MMQLTGLEGLMEILRAEGAVTAVSCTLAQLGLESGCEVFLSFV